jgi:hypothetical protein
MKKILIIIFFILSQTINCYSSDGKQVVIVCHADEVSNIINPLLDRGYTVASMTAENVSIAIETHSFMISKGLIIIVLNKPVPNIKK